jgi:cobalt-zinc-cadmium efflux system outer membrane protein
MKLMQMLSSLAGFALISGAQAQPLALSQALSLLDQHPQWQEAQAKIEQAQADQSTAGQYLNPSVELIGETRDKQSIAFYQPLETPDVRRYRQASADKGLEFVSYQTNWLRRQLMSQIERLYYQIAQRQQELALADEELALLTQLKRAVSLRVQVGESPRYEQVKAEAEWLTSKSRQRVANQQYVLARQQLAEKLALNTLPEVIQTLPSEPQQCVFAKSDQPPLAHHPITGAAQVSLAQSQDNLGYEQAQVTPQPTIILGTENDMGIDRVKLGVSLPLPLWHQRDGQIASAKAKVSQSRAQLNNVERQLKQDWTKAVLNYQIADGQSKSFESGLLAEAQAAFHVAQAAYKYGERGILDYIDAQRTLASVKRGYVNSQFERHYACIDIIQLSSPIEDKQ